MGLCRAPKNRQLKECDVDGLEMKGKHTQLYTSASRLSYIAGRSHDVHVELISQSGTLKTKTLRGMFVGRLNPRVPRMSISDMTRAGNLQLGILSG
jgi:hypothetical protein